MVPRFDRGDSIYLKFSLNYIKLIIDKLFKAQFELLRHKFKHLGRIEAVWISGICKLYIYETSEDFGNKTQQK